MTLVGDLEVSDTIEDFAGGDVEGIVPAIAGYTSFFDFSDPAEVALAANGMTIATVGDKGSGNHDASAVGDIYLAKVAALFGERKLAFLPGDASAYLTSACPTLGDVSSTAIVAGFINGLKSYNTLLAGQSSFSLQWVVTSAGVMEMFQSNVGQHAGKSNGSITDMTPFIAAYRGASGSCTQYLKLAGAAVTQETDASLATGASQLYIGRSPGTAHEFRGGLACVICHGTTLSDADTLTEIANLATLLGI